MIRIALLMLVGVAQADDLTFIATGTVNDPSWTPTHQHLNVGDTMQLEYTIDPSNVRTVVDGMFEGGPVIALSYSFNGSPFTNFYGDTFADSATPDGNSYSWDLQPSVGTEAYLNISGGQMSLRDLNYNGGDANITNIQQIGNVQQAPEIDPRGLAGGLTLLIGGLLVLRGRSASPR